MKTEDKEREENFPDEPLLSRIYRQATESERCPDELAQRVLSNAARLHGGPARPARVRWSSAMWILAALAAALFALSLYDRYVAPQSHPALECRGMTLPGQAGSMDGEMGDR